MRNYFNYFTEIEEHFIRRRGKNLLVSPLDWCLIELWRDNGIPLHIVFRGIDRSFESREGKGRKSPRSLFYCHSAVLEAFEEYRAARVGSADAGTETGAAEPALSPEEIQNFIAELRSKAEGLQAELTKRVLPRLEQIALEVKENPLLSLEDIDRTLSEAGSLVATELAESLDGAEKKALRAEIRKELRPYRKRLSPEMYGKLEQSYFERRVREHFGLPEFSLLHA